MIYVNNSSSSSKMFWAAKTSKFFWIGFQRFFLWCEKKVNFLFLEGRGKNCFNFVGVFDLGKFDVTIVEDNFDHHCYHCFCKFWFDDNGDNDGRIHHMFCCCCCSLINNNNNNKKTEEKKIHKQRLHQWSSSSVICVSVS